MTIFLSTDVSNHAADVSFTVLTAVIGLAVLLLTIWLLTKYIKRPKYAETFAKKLATFEALPAEKQGERPQKFSFVGIWFAIMLFGVLIRILFAFLTAGYRPDYYLIVGDLLLNASPAAQFSSNALPHYPLVSYIYMFFGLFARQLGMTAESAAMPFMVKLPLIVADIALMVVVYRAGKKHLNEYCALIFTGFVALFPPFMMLSSVWGSTYALLLPLLVATFYFMANKKMVLVFATFTAALLTSRSALYLFPVVAVFVVYQTVKAFLFMRRNKVEGGFKGKLKNPETKNAFLLPAYAVGFWLLSWLITLPLIASHSANPFIFTHMIYFYPLGFTHTNSYFGFNALNVFNLFVGVSGNGAPWTATPGMSALFSVLFGLIITALVILVYVTRKNRALLVFLAGYVYLTLSIFFIDFGAVNLIVVITLFVLAFMLVRDKRILLIAGVLGLILTLNISFVFMNAGFLNTLPASYFDPMHGVANIDWIALGGTTGNEGWLAANLVLSVLTIITFIYATVVILDIAMSNKRKLFSDLDNPSFLTSLKKFIKA